MVDAVCFETSLEPAKFLSDSLNFSRFIVCLYLPSEHHDFPTKIAVGIYVAFLFISVVPVFADAILPGTHQERDLTLALFFGIYSMFLSWIITALNVAAIYL